jgi:hypothetical protein
MQEIAFHSLRKSKTFNWTIYDIVAKALGMGENAIKTLANARISIQILNHMIIKAFFNIQ